MSLVECKSLLFELYQQNPNVARSTSFWQKQAWGSLEEQCLSFFSQNSEDLLLFMKKIESGFIFDQNTSSTTDTPGVMDSVTNSIDFGSLGSTFSFIGSSLSSFFGQFEGSGSFGSFGDQALWYLKMLVYIFLLLIAGFLLFKLIRYLFVFFYDVLNVNRMVYLKVLQTRGESKSEREVEKELSKDMKEKISRMSQVYNNMHKLGELSANDTVMTYLFRKPKITLIYQFEEGSLNFILATYPEYKSIVEGSLSAQFSNSSIETIEKPKFFSKKYNEILPLEPSKEPAYTIKTFRQMPDDPLNNIVDAIGKVSKYDTVSIVMPIKPEGNSFNKRAKFVADALYRKKKALLEVTPWWHYVLMPWKIIDFLINGPGKDKIDSGKEDGIIRMVKTEEETYNTMAEEASNWGFKTGLMLISSSDNPQNPKLNLNNLLSTYSIFTDQYGNSLDHPEWMADLLGFIMKPLWRFAVTFQLPDFFYTHNVFSVNELTTLFHLPDGVFNRSPVISWLDYKMLPAPDNLPMFDESTYNGFVMTGILAEKYRGGILSDVLKDQKDHWAVGSKVEKIEKLEPIEKFSEKDLVDKEIVEKGDKKFVKTYNEKTVWGYKMYRAGVLLGINIYRNTYSPIYFNREDRTRHHYTIGKSGTGKSVFLQSVARQDVWNGDGVCIIDPHGDLAEDMLEYIPKSRAKDVIFFDAGNEDRPMGLNLYEIDNIDQADRTVNDATEIFLKMFGGEIFGPRIQEYFKYGSLTILEDFEDRPTLLDVPRLYTDETYREFKTKKVSNPVVKNFWEKTYNAMGDREKQEIIPYFTSKFVSFNTNRLIRNIIGQTKSGFRFKEAMDNQKIVLVSLSKGKIGEINAQLLGMIMVSQIYNAAMGRASMAKEDRKDFYLYVDEFQNFVSATFADILSEARKYRLCLIMAHQYIAQLESGNKDAGGKGDVKAAVFGNCGTIMSFKIGAPDAEFLEKEYSPVLGAQDIVGIANYKAYIKLNINNSTSRVFSMNALYTNDYKNKAIAGILKDYSAKKYGRKREFVDAEIAARLGLDSAETPEINPEDIPKIPNPVTVRPGEEPVEETAGTPSV